MHLGTILWNTNLEGQTTKLPTIHNGCHEQLFTGDSVTRRWFDISTVQQYSTYGFPKTVLMSSFTWCYVSVILKGDF